MYRNYKLSTRFIYETHLFLPLLCLSIATGCKKEDDELIPASLATSDLPSSYSSKVTYPATGYYGVNLLDTLATQIPEGTVSLAADLRKGARLKLVITSLDEGIWYYNVGSGVNWAINTFDEVNHCQTFNAVNDGQKCDLNMTFMTKSIRIDYYLFGSDTVTYSRFLN